MALTNMLYIPLPRYDEEHICTTEMGGVIYNETKMSS